MKTSNKVALGLAAAISAFLGWALLKPKLAHADPVTPPQPQPVTPPSPGVPYVPVGPLSGVVPNSPNLGVNTIAMPYAAPVYTGVPGDTAAEIAHLQAVNAAAQAQTDAIIRATQPQTATVETPPEPSIFDQIWSAF